MAQNKEFSDWVTVHGGHISPSVDLFGVLPHGSRGIAATADIPQGEVLILMPMKACILALAEEKEDASSLQLNGLLKALPETVAPFLRTTLVLMHHISQGNKSPTRVYLDTFPKSHDCTLCWTAREMGPLKGTTIQHTGQRKSREVFKEHIKPVLEAQPHLFPGMEYENFEYAAGMVQSRSFSINQENFITGESTEGKELYLIPGIDMLNHSTRPEDVNTTLQRRTESVSKQSSSNGETTDFSGFFAIEAERPIKTGEEVLISYGELSDAQLLQTYGFVEEHPGFINPWNFITVPYDLVAQAIRAARMGELKVRGKRKRQEEEEADLGFFKLTEPSPEWDIVEEIEGHAFDHEVMPALLTLADWLTGAYEGTQKADEELLRSGGVQGRLRSAVLVRVAERRLARRFKEEVLRLLAEEEDRDEDEEQDGEEEDGTSDSMCVAARE